MLEQMLRGYVTCALWSSTDSDSDTVLDENYGPDDIHPDCLVQMREDCMAFLSDNESDIAQYAQLRAIDPSQGNIGDYIGHDFWLSRNRHGAGFFDHGIDPIFHRLQAAAKIYGSIDLYAGDDEMIHCQ